jgi:DHA1 family bicyclomycin/chloramphenicol resistance-like MFS transporter
LFKPTSTLRLGEFVALVALMTSLVALSIDAMLPALPEIGADLGAQGPNDAQLVISSLLLGIGVGHLLYGPLSDSIGRKPAIYLGLVVFLAGCGLSLLADDMPIMLIGRMLQGFGAAAPRIVTIALVRDQFHGREMARVMSFVTSLFILVPALAPALGQVIMLAAGWRAIFASFFTIAGVALIWFMLRQPETLPVQRRAPLSLTGVLGSFGEVIGIRETMGSAIAAGFVFAAFIGYLSTAQQLFQDTYEVGHAFPLFFAAFALCIGIGSLINTRFVMRAGMHRLTTLALVGFVLVSVAFLAYATAREGVPPLGTFLAWGLFAFACIGILFGNLNAMAMEPLGHVAGVGGAVVGSLSTLISVPIGALIGRAYDGTVLPLIGGFVIFGLLALVTLQTMATRR